jgi:hypothetical protein
MKSGTSAERPLFPTRSWNNYAVESSFPGRTPDGLEICRFLKNKATFEVCVIPLAGIFCILPILNIGFG